jgi:phage protein D
MTPGQIPIYEGQDFYVPHFQVKLEGRPPGQDVVRDITQVSYTDDIKQVDKFEITINNWDAEKRTFKYSDKKLFDPGKRLELWMGYYGRDRLRLMIKGRIESLRPSFPSAGQPTLAISGLNALHELRTKQEPQAYEKMTDSDIAQQIGSRLGVTIHTEQTASANEDTLEYLFQENEYPIVYLMKRAARIGYDLFVEEDGENGQAGESRIYFGPSTNVQEVEYKLTYGRSLIEFQPDLTTVNQVGAVTLRSWDQKRKKKIVCTVRRGDIRTRGVGASGGQADIDKSFERREEVVTDQPVESEAEGRRSAAERHERIAKEMIKGSGSTVGLPDLRAGSVVHIDGLGTRFSGRYFVTSTTHTIGDSGYTTKFQCRREEV